MSIIREQMQDAAPHTWRIEQSLDEIEASLKEQIHIASLSSGAFFSPYHYQRLFRAIVGDSVMEYVKKRRLSQAAMELCKTARPILEIALDYGYESHEGFSRAFKAVHGVTPTECRKYGIYTLYERVTTRKEKFIMSKAKEKLTEYTTGILRRLNEFAVQIRKAGELSGEVGRRTTIRGHVNLYAVLEQETVLLGERAIATCETIGAALHAVPGTEETDSCSALSLAQECLALLKYLDELCFQTKLLAFHAQVNGARIGTTLRSDAEPVIQAYQKLSESAYTEFPEITGLFRELAGLLLGELRAEYQEKLHELSALLSRTAQNVQTAETALGQEGNAPGGETWNLLGEETGCIKNELMSLADFVTTNQDGSFDLLSTVPEQVKSLAFRANILALDEKMELIRRVPPQSGQWQEGHLIALADLLHDAYQEAVDLLSQAGKLAALPQRVPEPSHRQWLEEILFQSALYRFYVKLETARFQHVATPVQQEQLTELLTSIGAKSERLAAQLKKPNSELTSEISDIVRHCGKDLREIASGLEAFAKAEPQKGAVFAFFAEEYTKFADRVEA